MDEVSKDLIIGPARAVNPQDRVIIKRYAEQMWDTFFAKVPEITLFNSQQITASLNAGNQSEGVDTNASLNSIRSGGSGSFISRLPGGIVT